MGHVKAKSYTDNDPLSNRRLEMFRRLQSKGIVRAVIQFAFDNVATRIGDSYPDN